MIDITGLEKLCNDLSCNLILNEPLKDHTSFRVGGNCIALVYINGVKSIVEIKKYLNKNNISSFILGKGSNVIAADEGYKGIILLIGKDYSKISLINNNVIYCQSGASLKDLCLFALENSLSGLEFAYGIPGTAGGALYMNAGAYGGEMKDIVTKADYIDEKLNESSISSEKMKLSYRKSLFSENNDYIITGIYLKLKEGSKEDIKNKMDEILQKRKDKQPLNYPSAGSTFKRPEGSYASLLIDQCGLKGYSVGDAQVSSKHSGFVINTGNAKSSDIITLANDIRDKVKSETGYTLELEPQILS